jgi:hypothetical protein
LPHPAAELGPGQAKLIAQDPKEGRVIRPGGFDLSPVDPELRHGEIPFFLEFLSLG